MEGFAAKADTLMVQAGRAAGETERGYCGVQGMVATSVR